MRITNSMMTNTMLLNLNKNANITNKYYTQMATSKRFSNPSEDPISASRALRFRTNISNTEQYQKNVQSAASWMDVTDSSFANITELMTDRISYLLNQGASDTFVISDRQKIVGEIDEILAQIAENEINASYAGRYVFSGYKTDEPPILTGNVTDTYEINQTFSYGDVWSKTSYQKVSPSDACEIENVDVLNLPYTNLDNPPTITLADGTPLTVETYSLGTSGAYDMSTATADVRYIPETGELVLSDSAKQQLMTQDVNITYEKTGFVEGDLNPKIYFKCTNLSAVPPVDYDTSDDEIMYGVSIGTDIKVNALAQDVYTDKMYAVLKQFTSVINSMEVSTEASLKAKYEGLGYTGEELDAKINEQLEIEENNIKTACHDIFNSMLKKLEGFTSTVSSEHTSLGTRMNRVDVIEARLGDDTTNYTTLMSKNEDTDYALAIMKLNSAETTYQAAMQVGAKIMQMSLVNYL